MHSIHITSSSSSQALEEQAQWAGERIQLQGRMLGLASLQISPCLVISALQSSPRLSAGTHPLLWALQPS